MWSHKIASNSQNMTNNHTFFVHCSKIIIYKRRVIFVHRLIFYPEWNPLPTTELASKKTIKAVESISSILSLNFWSSFARIAHRRIFLSSAEKPPIPFIIVTPLPKELIIKSDISFPFLLMIKASLESLKVLSTKSIVMFEIIIARTPYNNKFISSKILAEISIIAPLIIIRSLPMDT